MNEQGGDFPLPPYSGQYSSRRRSGGCIIGVALALIVVSGGLGFLLLRMLTGTTISVGTHPTIIADTCVGTVLVQAGPANQVTLSGLFPQYTQDSATNTITLGDYCRDTTITVPPVANLKIGATSGLTVVGVSGTMNLNSYGSRMELKQITLEETSNLDSEPQDAIVTTDGGPIVFSGHLAPGSTTTMKSYGGSIDATLSRDTSCQLTISGGPPSQLTSNIPGVRMPGDQSSDIHASIGNNPSVASLTLDVDDMTPVVVNTGT